MEHDRRAVLRGAAIGLVGFGAGCLDGTGGGGEQATGAPNGTENASEPASTTTATRTTSATSEPTATATESPTASRTTTASPTCESGLQRLAIDFPADYELAYSEGFGFELTAEPGTVAVGDSMTVSLRNATDEQQTTGPKSSYAIERRVDDGWQHVLQVPTDYTRPTEQVTHQPGEGFTWDFTVSQDGFSVSPYTVCAPLQSGEYHFTYFGFPNAMQGLTIAFDIE